MVRIPAAAAVGNRGLGSGIRLGWAGCRRCSCRGLGGRSILAAAAAAGWGGRGRRLCARVGGRRAGGICLTFWVLFFVEVGGEVGFGCGCA